MAGQLYAMRRNAAELTDRARELAAKIDGPAYSERERAADMNRFNNLRVSITMAEEQIKKLEDTLDDGGVLEDIDQDLLREVSQRLLYLQKRQSEERGYIIANPNMREEEEESMENRQRYYGDAIRNAERDLFEIQKRMLQRENERNRRRPAFVVPMEFPPEKPVEKRGRKTRSKESIWGEKSKKQQRTIEQLMAQMAI